MTKKKNLRLSRGKKTCLDRGTKVRGIIFSVEKKKLVKSSGITSLKYSNET